MAAAPTGGEAETGPLLAEPAALLLESPPLSSLRPAEARSLSCASVSSRVRRRGLLFVAGAMAASMGLAIALPFARRRPRGRGTAALGSAVSEQLLSSSFSTVRPVNLTFYMYRAQSDQDYPLENVNAADLPGVMWYLHNEILVSQPLKYNVTRILRFKVTMKNTQKMFEAYNTQFAPYVAYDGGVCTTPDCINGYKEYGYNVGCQLTSAGYYFSDFQTGKGCRNGVDCQPVWYSLPGACPNTPPIGKNGACATVEPGGRCRGPHLNQLGGFSCTYAYEMAGEVRLEELLGLNVGESYADWVKKGGVEYDKGTGQGRYTTFWNWINDKDACRERVRKVAGLFLFKYPELPDTLGEPPCNFS